MCQDLLAFCWLNGNPLDARLYSFIHSLVGRFMFEGRCVRGCQVGNQILLLLCKLENKRGFSSHLPRCLVVCAPVMPNCFTPLCLCLCCSFCSKCPFLLPLAGLDKTHFIDFRVSESRDLIGFICLYFQPVRHTECMHMIHSFTTMCLPRVLLDYT